jgi:hypothetical protein
MYNYFEPQKQICAAPNGPNSGKEHGLVFSFLKDAIIHILFDDLDLVKVIVVVVCCI